MAEQATLDEDNAWQRIMQGRSDKDSNDQFSTDLCFDIDWDPNNELLADCPDLSDFLDFNYSNGDAEGSGPALTAVPSTTADKSTRQGRNPVTPLHIPDAQATASGQHLNGSALRSPFVFRDDGLGSRVARQVGSATLSEARDSDLRLRLKRLEDELEESKNTIEMLRKYYVGLGPWVEETHRQTDCMWDLQHDMLQWQSCVEQSWLVSTDLGMEYSSSQDKSRYADEER